jgi:hypothetical protein
MSDPIQAPPQSAVKPAARKPRSPIWMLAFIGGALLIAMLHPYPRQSLIGPTIRGKPRCIWEADIRRISNSEEYYSSFRYKILRAISIQDEIIEMRHLDHPEMLPLLLELAEDRDMELVTMQSPRSGLSRNCRILLHYAYCTDA